VTFPASQVSEQYELPHIIDQSTQPSIMRRGFKWVFRMVMDSEKLNAVVVEFVEDMGKRTGHQAKKVALVSLDENYGRSSAEDFKKAIKKPTSKLLKKSTIL